MVLRKPPPPRLDNHRKELSRSNTRPFVSPGPKSASTAPPKRLTRPRRAQSSPQPRYLPSQESIFSPDLNTSPAFDLMSLEQAQRSPVETTSSDPQNPWAAELVEGPDQHSDYPPPASAPLSHTDVEQGKATDRNKRERVPSILLAGTQRRMATSEWRANEELNGEWNDNRQTPVELRSNNPFLKTSQSEQNPWQSESGHDQQHHLNVRGSEASDLLSQSEGYIPMTARLSLLDQPPTGSPWAEERPDHHSAQDYAPQAPAPNQAPFYPADVQHGTDKANIQPPFSQPEGISHDACSPYYAQQHAPIPQTEVNTASATIPPTTRSHALIDLDDQSQEELPQYGPKVDETRSTPAGTAPPLPQRPNETGVGEQGNRQNEQKSETYSIRHVNWTDTTGKLRQSPILSQNENGPCPLLALVNALVLRVNEDGQTPVVRALQTREQISLGLLIQALFEELITCLGPDDEFPDIEALSRFLTMLHTGMNVNPRLTLEPGNTAGCFDQTNDIRFYSTFGVPLIHGWVADPTSESHAAFMRVAQYHEDIQLLQFRKDDLEEHVIRGGTLSFDEEQNMSDIQTIQQFVDVDNATQLSSFGLNQLRTQLDPGSVSILFRNDHFSTLYKHPQSRKLYTLVTDAGYANHAEIVWECLEDVSGSHAEFFSGDFRPVGHGPSEAPPNSGSLAAPSHDGAHSSAPSDQPSQEQSDADYAYALALQFQEEEQRENSQNGDARDRRASAPQNAGQSHGPNAPHNRSSSTAHRNSTDRYPSPNTERRPARHSLPPRRSSQSSDGDDVPPPSYEQAASGRIQTSQQHRHSPSMPSTPSWDNRYPRTQPQYGRRPPVSSSSSGLPDRVKDRSKDCIVM